MIAGRLAAGGLAALLSACSTTVLAPDPAVDPVGRWTIAAVDGQPTGGGQTFFLEVEPPSGSAQFGCNRGSGPLTIADGWLVAGDPWIFTLGSCPNRVVEIERRGIQILAKPLAMERRTSGGIRLRNEVGSIDLSRTP